MHAGTSPPPNATSNMQKLAYATNGFTSPIIRQAVARAGGLADRVALLSCKFALLVYYICFYILRQI